MHGAKRRISRYGRGPPTTHRYRRRKKRIKSDINVRSTNLSGSFSSKGCRTARPRVIHSSWVRIPFYRCRHRSHLIAGRRRIRHKTEHTSRPLARYKYHPIQTSLDLYQICSNAPNTSHIWAYAHQNFTTIGTIDTPFDTPSQKENWAPDFIMRIICLTWFCMTAPFICRTIMEFSSHPDDNS